MDVTFIMYKSIDIIYSYLASTTATSVLPAFDKAGIPVSSNDPIVETTVIDITHGHFGSFTILIFNKAETTWRHIHAVEAHNNTAYFTCTTK